MNKYLIVLIISIFYGCSKPLHRPLVHSYNTALMKSYYVIDDEKKYPRTVSDCEEYLKTTKRESLIESVCLLNMKKYEELEQSMNDVQDSCYKKVIAYDLEIDNGLVKSERFGRLQELFKCSSDENFKEMIKMRSKLAHYE